MIPKGIISIILSEGEEVFLELNMYFGQHSNWYQRHNWTDSKTKSSQFFFKGSILQKIV